MTTPAISNTCPGGKELRRYRRCFRVARDGVDPQGLMRYRATKSDCDTCTLQPRCSPNAPARKVSRSIHEEARDIAAADAYVTSRRQREKVEMLFVYLKRIRNLATWRGSTECPAWPGLGRDVISSLNDGGFSISTMRLRGSTVGGSGVRGAAGWHRAAVSVRPRRRD